MDHAIWAEGLVKRFGETTALDGVDLGVRAGTVLGLLGPNGAGKTTAVRVLSTLLQPDAGHATVGGYDVVRDAHRVRQLIGLTGQNAAVDEMLTGTENLLLIGRLLGIPRPQAKARAGELLGDFGLTDAADRAVKTYSGGMRRRLDLAASLVGRPPMLYLDEPTTGLDPRARAEAWTLIRSMVAGGVTVLLTTQYLDEADELADEIVVIDHGRVIATGSPDELKAKTGSQTLAVRPEDESQLPIVDRSCRRAGAGDPGGRRSAGDRAGDRPSIAAGRRAPPRRRRRGGHRADVAQFQPERGVPVPDWASGGRGRTDRRERGMTAVTATAPAAAPLSPRVNPAEGIRQTLTLAWRTIVQVRHNPWELGDFSIQPIMFVLLFTYVFGGAIAGSTGEYLTFALPGIIVMNMLFVTMYVGTGLNTDLTKGVFDRLRSLPIARWAPMAGRILADQVKQAWSIVLLLGVGMILGFRIGTNFVSLVAAIVLLLVFALAFSWVSVLVGVLAKDPEHVQLFGFTVLFPVTFVSNVFVPTETMPSWLQPFVEANPVSILADACRGLMVTGAEATPIIQSLVWAAVIAAVFAPLSVWAFKRRVA